jgi:hypothetical protein
VSIKVRVASSHGGTSFDCTSSEQPSVYDEPPHVSTLLACSGEAWLAQASPGAVAAIISRWSVKRLVHRASRME